MDAGTRGNGRYCAGAGKRGLDERLTTTQILLQQQEEAVRRGDREKRALADRVKDLERSLQTSETDKKHTQVRLLSVFSHTAGTIWQLHIHQFNLPGLK